MKRRTRGTGEIRQVAGVWKIRYTLNGRRIQETAGPQKRDAVALLAKRLGAKAEGRLTAETAKTTWADIEKIILDEHAQHRSGDKVARHVRRHLTRHFVGLRVQALDYGRLLDYKLARLAEGASPSTVRYELSLVRTGLVVAERAGLGAHVPATLPSVHVENTRTTFFDDVKLAKLLENLSPHVAAVVTFLNWTGWRRNEALTREWRHVDFARGTITLEPGETKNGEGRTFPFDVLPELAALLRAQREYTDRVERATGQVCRWVFHRNGRRVVSIRNAWRRACRKAGLVDANGNVDHRPHDFRRTAVRRLERAGVSRTVAMKLVGHTTEAIYRRYSITNETDLREGLAKVNASAKAEKPLVKKHLAVS